MVADHVRVLKASLTGPATAQGDVAEIWRDEWWGVCRVLLALSVRLRPVRGALPAPVRRLPRRQIFWSVPMVVIVFAGNPKASDVRAINEVIPNGGQKGYAQGRFRTTQSACHCGHPSQPDET